MSLGTGAGHSHWHVYLLLALNPRGTFTGEFEVYDFARIINSHTIFTPEVMALCVQGALVG
jgi:hypothetical protein